MNSYRKLIAALGIVAAVVGSSAALASEPTGIGVDRMFPCVRLFGTPGQDEVCIQIGPDS